MPVCTSLIAPLNGAIDVAVDTNIEWQAITDATGYRLTVSASNSNANNVTNLDIASGTSYDFPSNFEQGETVTVSLIPYNAAGDAIGCAAESFTIKSIPQCTSLISPTDGEIVVSATEISWNAIDDANGYRITVTGGSSTENNVTDFEVTGTTYAFPNNFEEGETVNVTIVPFNEVGDAIGCPTESFTILPIPECTNLVLPLNGSEDVSVSTDLEWNPSEFAEGYRISVGTSPNGTDIVNNEDVASLTSYTFADDLLSETTIYVNIIPYNASGDAIGCSPDSFTTEVVIPDCTALISPFNGETDVPLEATISWETIEKTNGYRISLGTTNGGTDILDNLDVGLETSYTHPNEFPFGTRIYVNIVPYNTAGDAVECNEQSFTTVVPEDDTKYGLSPDGDGINDYWHIDNIQYYPENTVFIYNRWGDLVFQMNNYDNSGNVFRGEANKLTKLGAGQLPEGTYFFVIQVPNDNILKSTKGYVILKR